MLASLLCWFALLTPVRAEPVFDPDAAETVRARELNTLEIARIRSGVLPGVVIGGRYEGLLKILQQRYTAPADLDERFEESARSLIEDELSQAGFDVMRSQPRSVFAESVAEPLEPGRFLIGGTIVQARLNSYTSWFGDRTHDERTIRWELFDRDRMKVVCRKETTGIAEAEGVDNPAATYEAIRSSLKQLLTEPEFRQLSTQTRKTTVAPMVFEIPAIAASPQLLSVEQIAGRSIPSIVRIRTAIGRGSGFLVNSSGLIVTNQHVVDSALSVNVDFYDGSTRIGRVLRRDAAFDAALVKLDGDAVEVPGLPICQTNAVRVGEAVVAIGNPLSFSNTVTQGIVSGFRGGTARSLIQTDSAINPGNSGGPLLNRHGAVIGIVTEKMSSKGIEGLGFALPIDAVFDHLKIKVNRTDNTSLDTCGNPIASSQSIVKNSSAEEG